MLRSEPKSRSAPARSPPTKHQRLVVLSTAIVALKLPFTTRPSATTKSSSTKPARTRQRAGGTKAAQAKGMATVKRHSRGSAGQALRR